MTEIDPFPPLAIIGTNVGIRVANQSSNYGDKMRC
jgi:hypothetical protein